MYNNQGRKLQAGHDGLFRTVISVEEGPLEFCFVTAGKYEAVCRPSSFLLVYLLRSK